MLVNLSENISRAKEIMTQKSSIYLLGMSSHIFNLIFKTSTYPFVASICWYVYLTFLFLKRRDFGRLNFAFKKFQEIGTKSLFLSFQNSSLTSYFPISQEPRDRNSLLTPLWNNKWMLNCKCWKNQNGQIYRNQDNGRQFFQIIVKPQIP